MLFSPQSWPTNFVMEPQLPRTPTCLQVELYNKAMSGRSTGRLSRFFGSNNGRTSPAPMTPAPSISVDDMLICQQVCGARRITNDATGCGIDA